MSAPTPDAAAQRVLDARILVQSEETVGAEVDDSACPPTSMIRLGAIRSTTMSFMCVVGKSSAKCSMKRIKPFWRRALARCCIGVGLIRTFFSTLRGLTHSDYGGDADAERAHQTKNYENGQAQKRPLRSMRLLQGMRTSFASIIGQEQPSMLIFLAVSAHAV